MYSEKTVNQITYAPFGTCVGGALAHRHRHPLFFLYDAALQADQAEEAPLVQHSPFVVSVYLEQLRTTIDNIVPMTYLLVFACLVQIDSVWHDATIRRYESCGAQVLNYVFRLPILCTERGGIVYD